MKYTGLETTLFLVNVLVVVLSIAAAFLPGKVFLG